MAKVFRQLMLAAVNGGKRYIRAMLVAVVSLTSRASSAPGKTIEAKKSVTMPEGKVVATSNPVADEKYQGLFVKILMSAQMITKLVSSFTFSGRTLANLITDMVAGFSATIDGIFRFAVGLFSKADACPGTDVETKHWFGLKMKSTPKTSAPEHIGVNFETVGEISAKVSAAETKSATADLEATHTIAVELEPSESASLGDMTLSVVTDLRSRLIVWVAPEWVDGNTLYIRQVYETERDGNVLILH